MRLARIAPFLVIPLLALTACSSGKKSSSASPTTANTTAATAPTTTAKPASNDPFCNFVRTYNDRFGKINPGALSDPQQFRSVMQDAVNSIKDAANAAPASIKPDVTTMSNAMQSLFQAFQQANFDATKINVASLTALQAPEFVSAAQRIDAYTRQNCQ